MSDQLPFDSAKQTVADGYDQVAAAYARLDHSGDWPRMRWLDKLLALVPAGSAILDLGCGNGDPADIAIARQHQVTGVDISPAQVELARQNVPTGRFLAQDLGSADFATGIFAAVVSFYTLEHLPRTEHQAVLDKIHTWLQPGGKFLIGTEAAGHAGDTGEWLGVPMYFSSFDAATLLNMVKTTGFTILETATEPQTENGETIDYLWILAQKSA